jgi:hypothetical protein
MIVKLVVSKPKNKALIENVIGPFMPDLAVPLRSLYGVG